LRAAICISPLPQALAAWGVRTVSRTSRFFAAATALALVACTGGKPATASSGGAALEVNTSALSTGVTEVLVDVLDAGNIVTTLTLTRGTGGAFTGTVGGLPVGVPLTFAATAVATDGAIYAGEAVVTLDPPPAVASVTIKLQESAPPGFQNQAPRLTSITSTSRLVAPGQGITVAVAAADPDPGDVLTYAWTATFGATPLGSFADPTAASTTWTAPSTAPYEVTISVTVSDGRGGFAKASQLVTVTTASTLQNVAFVAILNDAPVITAVANTPLYDPATGLVPFDNALAVTATDADGPAPLTYLWEVDTLAAPGCAGDFLDPVTLLPDATVQDPVFSPIAAGDGGLCAAMVTVTDGRGASIVGRAVFAVDLPPTNGVPRLVSAFQSASSVGAGAIAYVKALFFLGPDPLVADYTWTSEPGADPIAITGASTTDLDLMLVTFPAACAGPVTYTVTATALDPVTSLPMQVTDPVSGTTSTVFKDFVFTACAP
jgi:hypothetical protein